MPTKGRRPGGVRETISAMDIDGRKLVAFGLSAVGWLVALAVLGLAFHPELVPPFAVYYLVFTVAVASRRLRTEVILLAAWIVYVVAGSVLVSTADNGIVPTVLLGGIWATFLVGGWVAVGFLLLLAIDRDRRKVVA
jgi:hypothetical protein